MHEVDIQPVKTPEGEIRFAMKLGSREYEILAGLNHSDPWKLYREILMRQKNALFDSCLAEDNPNRVLKLMGQVAGLNLAINQLVLLNDEYKKKQARSVDGMPKNHPQN